ncbi:MAG: hypothetical protein DRG83_15320, partial [Deltaproteobacteria bacterium]
PLLLQPRRLQEASNCQHGLLLPARGCVHRKLASLPGIQKPSPDPIFHDDRGLACASSLVEGLGPIQITPRWATEPLP